MLIQLLIVLLVLGIVWYFVENYLPVAEPFKMAARVIIVIILILFLLSLIGYGPGIGLR